MRLTKGKKLVAYYNERTNDIYPCRCVAGDMDSSTDYPHGFVKESDFV